MQFNVVAAQIKPKKADYNYNLCRIGDLFEQIDSLSPRPDVLVAPETVMSGYFLEGGVREVARSRDSFFQDLQRAYRERTATPNSVLDIAIGFYEVAEGKYFNSALYATLSNGQLVTPEIRHVHRKFFLPTYGVFDEKRFVARGRSVEAFDTRFGRVAVLICEDVWHSIAATIAALDGAQVIYVLSASPGREFSGRDVGNLARWKLLLPGIADEHNVFVVYSGLVGFEGGKGFTGSSSVVDPWGKVIVTGPITEEALVRAEIDLEDVAAARAGSPMLADLEATLPDIVLELDSIARRPHHS